MPLDSGKTLARERTANERSRPRTKPSDSSASAFEGRPAVVAQRRLEGLVNQRPQVQQATRLQADFDRSTGVAQRVVLPVEFGPGARWYSTELPDQTFATEAEAQAAEDKITRWKKPSLVTPLRFGKGAQWGATGFGEISFDTEKDAYDAERRRLGLGEQSLLFSAENLLFSTKEQGRQPTRYFQSQVVDNSKRKHEVTGRLRQQHDDGPLVKTDERAREHAFFSPRKKVKLENQVGLDDAQEGYQHWELEKGKVVHESGGTLDRTAPSAEELEKELLAAIAKGKVRNEWV